MSVKGKTVIRARCQTEIFDRFPHAIGIKKICASAAIRTECNLPAKHGWRAYPISSLYNPLLVYMIMMLMEASRRKGGFAHLSQMTLISEGLSVNGRCYYSYIALKGSLAM